MATYAQVLATLPAAVAVLLPLAALKVYLRVEHGADDALLARLVASAAGVIEGHLDRPLGAAVETFVLEDPRAPLAGGLASDGWLRPTLLRVPMSPVAADPAPIVVGADGQQLPVAALVLQRATGLLTPARGVRLEAWPYQVTAKVGLGTRADFDTVVAPALAQAIVDCVADWYQRRSPNAAAEGSGGGVYTQYAQGQLGMPPRLVAQLAPFRRVTA